MAYFLGVDTGGTFTDFVLYDSATESMRTHKVLSTPASPEQAILQGIQQLGIDTSSLTLVHGSTVATNAVLEGKGVNTVYLTNRGLADVLRIGRQAREKLYDLRPKKTAPLIPPANCIEVDSRLSAQGEHLHKLDQAGLEALAEQLARLSPDAVAINLLFSFLDAGEEIRLEQHIRKLSDQGRLKRDLFISRSSDVLPEYGEFERGMTTTLNAMVGPLMQGYLTRLQSGLGSGLGSGLASDLESDQNIDLKHGVSAPATAISVMQSTGGTTSIEQAGRYPVNLLLSGPAGGLTGAQHVASLAAMKRLLTFDMGGTSTDVSIIDHDIGFTSSSKIGGHPVAVPMVDMHTIGAGGGSIARVDAGGLLLVGPESAGASPGPACYGNGGTQATVTDANVVLGRIPVEAALAGNMQLDVSAAHEAVHQVADELGLSTEQAAAGIIEVVNDHMVRALRVMSVERGEDPEDYVLVAFGGAGGLHVCALADSLEMKQALVPVNAGVLSALGMLAADASRERSRSINMVLQNCDEQMIDSTYAELEQQAVAELNTGHDVHASGIEIQRTVDVRYRGQSHCLNMPWQDLASLAHAFHTRHEQSYGHQLDMIIELVNLRVRALAHAEGFTLPRWQASEVFHVDTVTLAGYDQPVGMIRRVALGIGYKVDGPALITEDSATLWLAENWQASVDAVGNLILTRLQD